MRILVADGYVQSVLHSRKKYIFIVRINSKAENNIVNIINQTKETQRGLVLHQMGKVFD